MLAWHTPQREVSLLHDFQNPTVTKKIIQVQNLCIKIMVYPWKATMTFRDWALCTIIPFSSCTQYFPATSESCTSEVFGFFSPKGQEKNLRALCPWGWAVLPVQKASGHFLLKREFPLKDTARNQIQVEQLKCYMQAPIFILDTTKTSMGTDRYGTRHKGIMGFSVKLYTSFYEFRFMASKTRENKPACCVSEHVESLPIFPISRKHETSHSLSSVLTSLFVAKKQNSQVKNLMILFHYMEKETGYVSFMSRAQLWKPSSPNSRRKGWKRWNTGRYRNYISVNVPDCLPPYIFSTSSCGINKNEHTSHTPQNILAPWKKTQVKWGNLSATY